MPFRNIVLLLAYSFQEEDTFLKFYFMWYYIYLTVIHRILFQSWGIYCFGYSSRVTWPSSWSCITEFRWTVWDTRRGSRQWCWGNSLTEVSVETTQRSYSTHSPRIGLFASKATCSDWICSETCMLILYWVLGPCYLLICHLYFGKRNSLEIYENDACINCK